MGKMGTKVPLLRKHRSKGVEDPDRMLCNMSLALKHIKGTVIFKVWPTLKPGWPVFYVL
jgi:hypothetical protein